MVKIIIIVSILIVGAMLLYLGLRSPSAASAGTGSKCEQAKSLCSTADDPSSCYEYFVKKFGC